VSVSLSDFRIDTVVAVTDLDAAREFYGEVLGLDEVGEVSDAGMTFSCGERTNLYVYPSPDRAGKSSATMAFWSVPDLDEVIDALTARGVKMEQYNQDGLDQDDRGIHTLGGSRVAWFCDPDGNTFAIEGPLLD